MPFPTTKRYFLSSRVFTPSSPSGAPGTIEVALPAGTISSVHGGRIPRPEGVADADWVDVGERWLLPGVRLCLSLGSERLRRETARRRVDRAEDESKD